MLCHIIIGFINGANPIALQKVLKNGKIKLPIIEFEFEDKIYTLEEFLKNINLNNYK